LLPCRCVNHDHNVDHLDDDSQVGSRCDQVGCFNGYLGICDYNAGGSSIHGYMRQEDEPFPFLWLLLVLGNLLKNVSCLVGCFTLLKESNHPEWVGRHRLVQAGKLVLVCLRLCKEDLLTPLLRRGYVHQLMEVVILKVAEKLHSTPRELVHWHKSRLLGHMEPANQLVAYIWETGDSLNVIPDALVEV
jgi:hypothetical protein